MKAARPTLLILTPGFPANERETYWVPTQQNLVRALKQQLPGFRIVVISYGYPKQPTNYTWHGVEVQSTGAPGQPWFLRIRKIWSLAAKEVKRSPVKAILSFWCREGAFAGSWLAAKHQLPHLCWISGQDATSKNKLVKWIRPKASELVAISDFISTEFQKNFRIRPFHVIPNGVDTTDFSFIPTTHRDIDILGVGSLIPLKRFDLFLEVVAEMHKGQPDLKAIIVGSGEEREKLLSRIHELGLEAQVELKTATYREEVISLMHRTKLLLHPSQYEGFSTVCLEALYAGARVLSRTRAMYNPIPNWEVADKDEVLAEKCRNMLGLPHPAPAFPDLFPISASARTFIDLLQLKVPDEDR